MDMVGSEIGQKMRSAIKAKLTELGCYVDDELPDYVMVMVANKRTRGQMEDDLQLFLGDNTEQFVNWLHQVLKKLQEVTVTTPAKPAEQDMGKEKSLSKDKKSKEKKDKKSELKKAKKKEKAKLIRKKEEKKAHKSKKKSKHHEMIRPNIPPLLMNMEKESEPSITDVFAGQILKNHGITLDLPKDDPKLDVKPEIKRPVLPIIDPSTIQTQSESSHKDTQDEIETNNQPAVPVAAVEPTEREEQIKEINEIEAKILGLKQKLTEQLDSMSEDDEDFLNIRTEAEELMNDFAEDVFQEISAAQAPAVTPPPQYKSPTPPLPVPPTSIPPKPTQVPQEAAQVLLKQPMETLPQIELNLPKRPIRERLGARHEPKKAPEVKQKEDKRSSNSPERFTPEREPEFRPQPKSAKSRLGDPPEATRKQPTSENSVSENTDTNPKRISSRVSVLDTGRSRAWCASVVRVRPRPRVPASAPSLLLRAVADAHKSLLNIPPKIELEPQKVKRALVLPMRRCVDAQKIVIQVPATRDTDERTDTISLGEPDSEEDKNNRMASDADGEEYVPASITKKIANTDYVPSRRNEGRTASRIDDTLIIETINIHNPTIGTDKNTQFIVTMDGFNPNAFLAKKLLTEGLLNEDEERNKDKEKEKEIDSKPKEEKTIENSSKEELTPEKKMEKEDHSEPPKSSPQKRLSNTSLESDTQVIIQKVEYKPQNLTVKRKSVELNSDDTTPVKKRKASPIVFNAVKKETEEPRQRTESAGSDNHVVVTTAAATAHKYDSVPPLSVTPPAKPWCRAFPQCRYGSTCAFQHPRCKFAASCTRRNCAYSHPPGTQLVRQATPSVASHVVPAANYKTITGGGLPSVCKFYPNCVNPGCHFYHPKPCRYGKNCVNKLECNFYHADVHNKFRFPV